MTKRTGLEVVGVVVALAALVGTGYGVYAVDHQATRHALAVVVARDRRHARATVTTQEAMARSTAFSVRLDDAQRQAEAVATARAQGYATAVAMPDATARAEETVGAATAAVYIAQATMTAQAIPATMTSCTDTDYTPSVGCTSLDQTMGVADAQNGRLCIERNALLGTQRYTIDVQQQQMDGSESDVNTKTDRLLSDNSGTCWPLTDLVPTTYNGAPVAAIYTFVLSFGGYDVPSYSVTIHS